MSQVYEVGLMFVALFIASVLMAKIMELFQLLNKENNEFRSRVKAISDFMKLHQIPINFQVKVSRVAGRTTVEACMNF